MEQKQLDETFEGEEFIDDLENIKVEPASKRGRKAAKVARKANAEKHTELHAEEKKVESKPALEPKPLIDPWADSKNEEPGMFSDAGTWKVVTGILIILLIFSVFTQGFRFSGKGALTGGATVSLPEAEKTAATFVNTNLLRPPFTAEVTSSAEQGDLYKVTLSVAGQQVDSYLTKDGKLFFPQGFDTTKSLKEQMAAAAEPKSAEQNEQEGVQVENVPSEEQPPETEPQVDLETEPQEPQVENVIIVPLLAKKWAFLPNKITVQRGETVQLNIAPSFQFTFALPDYGIGQEITDPTTIEFKADKVGKFPFLCSSCESFRGMTGTLTVE